MRLLREAALLARGRATTTLFPLPLIAVPGTRPARALLAPGGLTRRLVGGTHLAWGIGLFLFALAFGVAASSIPRTTTA